MKRLDSLPGIERSWRLLRPRHGPLGFAHLDLLAVPGESAAIALSDRCAEAIDVRDRTKAVESAPHSPRLLSRRVSESTLPRHFLRPWQAGTRLSHRGKRVSSLSSAKGSMEAAEAYRWPRPDAVTPSRAWHRSAVCRNCRSGRRCWSCHPCATSGRPRAGQGHARRSSRSGWLKLGKRADCL